MSVNGDTAVEPNETFFVNLSGATNATTADSQGQGTIRNDDLSSSGACTITGTNGSDVLSGTAGTDVICALGGDDQASGLGGRDVLRGGSGKDLLLGGDDADLLLGESGYDDLRGQLGNDTLRGGEAATRSPRWRRLRRPVRRERPRHRAHPGRGRRERFRGRRFGLRQVHVRLGRLSRQLPIAAS